MAEFALRTEEIVLSVSDVEYRTGPAFALRPVNVVVGPGKGVAVVGTNGAGKTTLIRMVAGLVRPDRGEIRIKGVAAHQSRQVAPYVGYVQQSKELPDGLTVETYVRHQLKLRRADPHRYDELIALADLGRYEKQYVRRLSGGGQRRVHIICAVAHRPALLILDEPTVGLDPAAREALLKLLLDLKKSGVSLFFATHHREELVALADSVVALHDGRQVLNSPLADFISLGAHADLLLEPFHRADLHRLLDWARWVAESHEHVSCVDADDAVVQLRLAGAEDPDLLAVLVSAAAREGLQLRSAAYNRCSLSHIVKQLAEHGNSGETT